ncbi:MAG: SGNH/GDSL hydrolase family protein [Alistipes sp.]|nr:SGNH/GDSL hydrolase family protein [Candidatus Alistipes equi]
MKNYLKLTLLLVIPLGLYTWHCMAEESKNKAEIETSVQEDNEQVQDTVKMVDRKPHNILLFGDSMILYMNKRLGEYCAGNGHTWHTVVWVSSTIKQWASCDTLNYFLRKYNPDYVLICLGSNEQFIKDPSSRQPHIKKILKDIGGRHCAWICPPGWKKDTGINELIKNDIGAKRFFDTRNFTIPRGKDNIHPTGASSALWMDHIAAWLRDSTATEHPILMNVPDTVVPTSKNAVYLKPLR